VYDARLPCWLPCWMISQIEDGQPACDAFISGSVPRIFHSFRAGLASNMASPENTWIFSRTPDCPIPRSPEPQAAEIAQEDRAPIPLRNVPAAPCRSSRDQFLLRALRKLSLPPAHPRPSEPQNQHPQGCCTSPPVQKVRPRPEEPCVERLLAKASLAPVFESIRLKSHDQYSHHFPDNSSRSNRMAPLPGKNNRPGADVSDLIEITSTR
jgi:hypothetical protein